jgi:quercetin dioxygenase-like cupin family protein
MNQDPVMRVTLADHVLATPAAFGHVAVQRISLAPNVMPGAHWHNGPVLGVIESGSVHFQVGDAAETILRAGDTFFEPGDRTITRFDATGEGVTFVGWFPLPVGVDPGLTMGPAPSEG